MFHLKPFPESLQVRVAVYRDVKKDLSSELTEVRVPLLQGYPNRGMPLICGMWVS